MKESADVERLRELIVDLEQAGELEHELRLEADALLNGLRALSFAPGDETRPQPLLSSLRGVLDFEDAFILSQREDEWMTPAASTSPRFDALEWIPGPFSRRVLNGHPVALFDMERVPEWREQPPHLLEGIRSALHVGLPNSPVPGMLVCTHPERGHFDQKHVRSAQRVAPLAAQVLVNMELRRTAAERDRFFALSLNMIGILGGDGRFRQLNPAWERVLGYRDEELKGNPFVDFVPEEDRPSIVRVFNEIAGTTQTRTHEHRFRCRDGSVRWLLTGFSGAGDERLYYCVAEDIHHRKEAEQQLARSEKLYRGLYEACRDGYARMDLQGNILEFNSALENMLGYSAGELSRLTCRDVTHPHSRSSEDPGISRQLRERGYSDLFEKQCVRKDGTVFPTEVRAYLIMGEDGEPEGTWAYVRDLSRKKIMENELLRAQKLESLGTLAGGIAHDFNNILTAVLGHLSLARAAGGSFEFVKKRLELVEHACSRAVQLTQQLLAFARGDAPVKKSVSLEQLIRESATFVLRGSNVRCEFSIPADLWHVEADEGQLNQVINNLVINADQAMPDGGVIHFDAVNVVEEECRGLPLNPGRYVKLTIRDEGVGIAAECLPRVFDPYFTTKQEGSGLGLAAVHSIVMKHGGHVTVRSGEGEGTTFEVFLPVSDIPPVREVFPESRLHAGQGRILVMDDDQVVREVLAEMLKFLGYRTEFAGDGERALEMYRWALEAGNPFDAVLMDLTIPGGMGGKEAVRRLLELDPDAKTLVTSGYLDDPVMSEYAAHGFVGMVSKPYRVDELSEALQRALASDRCVAGNAH